MCDNENEMYNEIDLNKNYLYKFNISKKYYTIFNNKTILPIYFLIIRIRNFKDLYFFTEKYGIIEGKYLMTKIILKPILTIPEIDKFEKAQRVLEKSENACLISNSIKSVVQLRATINIEN